MKNYYSFQKGKFGFSFVMMEMGGKKEIHDFMKAVCLKEITAVRRNFTRAIAARKTGPEHY